MGTNFDKETYRIFKSLPGAILGSPGTPQARKVWIYLGKTGFFKDRPFRVQGLPRSILGPKTEPKWSHNASQNRKKRHLEIQMKKCQKRHPKWSPNGSKGGPSGVQKAPRACPGRPRETPRITHDLPGPPRDPPGHHFWYFSAHLCYNYGQFSYIFHNFRTICYNF